MAVFQVSAAINAMWADEEVGGKIVVKPGGVVKCARA
jgi:hypothetical protein